MKNVTPPTLPTKHCRAYQTQQLGVVDLHAFQCGHTYRIVLVTNRGIAYLLPGERATLSEVFAHGERIAECGQCDRIGIEVSHVLERHAA